MRVSVSKPPRTASETPQGVSRPCPGRSLRDLFVSWQKIIFARDDNTEIMMKRFFIAVMLLFPLLISAQVRTERLLETGWKFTREDSQQFAHPDYDDSDWQTVRIPHDWAIYGPFSINNDKQNVAITQDGQKEAMEHAGRTGGLPFVGPGWYRLEFEAPEYAEGKSCRLIFDGAMSNADVYINGEHAAF